MGGKTTRNKLIAGNWKMNMSRQESIAFAEEFSRLYQPMAGVKTVICPPFVWLDMLSADKLPQQVELGAQNMAQEVRGAFTGEVSASMLVDAGCRYVILGHSERRQMGETDAVIREKTRLALLHNLIPIVCVGEREQERKNGQAQSTVLSQVRGSLADLEYTSEQMVIAYEPVWAIGTGNTASAADAEEMTSLIRSCLQEMAGYATASNTLILYGGSVTPDNARSLLEQPDVDGALVGGASLDPTKFCSIITSGRSH